MRPRNISAPTRSRVSSSRASARMACQGVTRLTYQKAGIPAGAGTAAGHRGGRVDSARPRAVIRRARAPGPSHRTLERRLLSTTDAQVIHRFSTKGLESSHERERGSLGVPPLWRPRGAGGALLPLLPHAPRPRRLPFLLRKHLPRGPSLRVLRGAGGPRGGQPATGPAPPGVRDRPQLRGGGLGDARRMHALRRGLGRSRLLRADLRGAGGAGGGPDPRPAPPPARGPRQPPRPPPPPAPPAGPP